ncbi:O-antigen ligase domain-containing protein [Elioraea sp.]|uniref:O-antigen ligase domain-containing protein n=1 Tax=Elioraea sp. TaxID=2185103 RepID=UPI003F70A39A
MPTEADPAASGAAAALGIAAAALQFAAALKGLPGLADLPLDITPPLLAIVLGLAAWRLLLHPHRIGAEAALLIGLQALLALWLTTAGAWSGGAETLPRKLAEIVLLGPAMTVAGLAVAAHPHAFRGFAAGCAAIGLAVALAVPLAVAAGIAVLGGATDAETIRVQYQVATLALAAAAAVLAAGAAEARPAGTMLRIAGVAGLALAALATGGRAGLVGLAAAVVLAPAAVLAARGRIGAALAVGAGAASALGLGLALVLALTDPAGTPRTLARWLEGALGAGAVRPILWAEAWRLATPLGLGSAGFAPTAGLGDLRGWHPHNLGLEALAEGGVPAASLLLAIALVCAATLIRRAREVPPVQLGATVGFACVALAQATSSTDLGNRMAWLWVGIVTGLAVRALPRRLAVPA